MECLDRRAEKSLGAGPILIGDDSRPGPISRRGAETLSETGAGPVTDRLTPDLI